MFHSAEQLHMVKLCMVQKQYMKILNGALNLP